MKPLTFSEASAIVAQRLDGYIACPGVAEFLTVQLCRLSERHACQPQRITLYLLAEWIAGPRNLAEVSRATAEVLS